MHRSTAALFAILCGLCLTSARGDTLRFSNTYGNDMVLQRAPLQSQVWGFASKGDVVTVHFNDRNYTAQVDNADLTWHATLDAVQAGGPYTITASSKSSGSATLTGVMFGDVYLCGGQSNMQFTVHQMFNATEEIAVASKYPQIRLFTVGQGNVSATPLRELASIEHGWAVASSEIVGANDWGYFSAVCWVFGRRLADTNSGVPIGLISNNWGGTIVQAWMPTDALAKCPSTYDGDDAVDADPNQNSVLYNAMINPFIGQTIFGAIWYQGEQNVGQAKQYSCWFPQMILSWRSSFARGGAFPFFFVQLAPWSAGAGTAVAEIRAAQMSALTLPNVGYATAVDLGDADATNPFGNIHPRDKEDVGHRLSLSARAVAYGYASVAHRGPEFARAAATSGASVQYTVSFVPESAQGLVVKPAACPAGINPVNCENFAVLLSDNKWYPTNNAQVTPANELLVTLENVPTGLTAKGLRYAYSSWPVCTIYNGAGLPAVPFISV